MQDTNLGERMKNCVCGVALVRVREGYRYPKYCAVCSKSRDLAQRAEATRRWRIAHPERAQQSKRKWRASHPETALAASRRHYSRQSLAQLTAQVQRRRARLRDGRSPGVTPAQWQEICEVFGHACAYCLRTDRKLTRDHVIPITRNGLDEPDNIVPACHSCNSRKHNSLLILWGTRSRMVSP